MQIVLLILKHFTKAFDEYICAECPPNRNFRDLIEVQDLKRIHVWNFFDVPSSTQNPGAVPVYSIYCIFISCHQGRSQVLIIICFGGSWGNINLSIKTIIQNFKLYCKFLSFSKCFEKLFINISIILESFAIFKNF